MAPEPWRLSAAELLQAYARKELSPVEVLEDVLARIERLNPLLRSYLAVNAEDARRAAKEAERRWLSPGEKPLLCGVPVSVKDTIEMAGLPTTYGSLAFKANYQEDSEIVLRLRRAGAVITGKTNTPEFALLGAVRNRLGEPGVNPWNLAHTCGGSSGGAGSALAAGLGPLAIGTDSGGSVRVPGAYNGVFALKPTYQRIPAVQRWRAAPGRSHNGPMTRTVRDSALLMEALAGPHAGDPASELNPPSTYLDLARGNIRGARVAVSHAFGHPLPQDDEVLSMLEQAAGLLRRLGCTVVEADPPSLDADDELKPGVWAYSGDHYAGAEAMIPDFWQKHAGDLTDYIRPVYDAGRNALAWQYRRILRRNQAYAVQMKEWFRNFDFLLSPVAGPAPRVDVTPRRSRDEREFAFLVAFNTSYNPAAAVPFGFHSSGLPLAVQVVGRLGDDVGVLRMSAAIEAEQPWGDRWPPLASAT